MSVREDFERAFPMNDPKPAEVTTLRKKIEKILFGGPAQYKWEKEEVNAIILAIKAELPSKSDRFEIDSDDNSQWSMGFDYAIEEMERRLG